MDTNSESSAATNSSLFDRVSITSSFVYVISLLLVIGLTWLWVYRPEFQPVLSIITAAFGLAGIYPLTYVAYLSFRERAQRKRLEDDFRLLGLVQEEDLEETVDKLYQTAYSRTQFVAYIGLIIVDTLLVLASYLYRENLGFVSPEAMTLIFYGYLGAYVFSIQELVRRYNTFDLRPQVYSSILVRILIATIITLVGASVITLGGGQIAGNSGSGNEPQAWAAVLAFLIGVFPSRGIQWFSQRANTVLNSPTDQATELSLRNLLGVSTWHEARLTEMGIDDAQNLATVDIRKLLLTTQFDTQQIIHWIDQAVLYVKVGSKIDRFRDAQITTFHELRLVLNELRLNTLIGETSDQQATRLAMHEKLVAALGLANIHELARLADHSSFPNYSHIVEYYARTTLVARQRANIGMEVLIGALEETDYERAVENGERLLRHNPDDARVLTNLGLAYYHVGQQDKARVAINRALALNKSVQGYIGLSLIHIAQGEYDQAIQACTSAINIDRHHALAFHNRGLAYSHLRYPDRAIEDFNEALELDDRLGVVYYNRGLVYNTQGNFKLALADFERAYLLGVTEAALWFAWGKALIGVGDFEGAVQKLSRAVLYEADLVRAYAERGYAYLQLGAVYYTQARSDLEIALKKDSNLWITHNNLGILEARLGNYEAAISHYQRTLELDPAQFVTRYNLAVTYYNMDRMDEARANFLTVASSAPVDSFETREAQEWLAHHYETTLELTGEKTNGRKTEQSEIPA